MADLFVSVQCLDSHKKVGQKLNDGAAALMEKLDGAAALRHIRPDTPGSVSVSFRGASDGISVATVTPRTSMAGQKSKPLLRPPSNRSGGTTDQKLENLLRRPRSSLESGMPAKRRFQEHGPVFHSTYRSVSVCGFGRAKRQICEKDIKENMEKEYQQVIRHDLIDAHKVAKPPPTGTFGASGRGHWSEKAELPHGRWSQQVQRGHHSPNGASHERENIFNRTAHGNQTMHDFFE